MFALPVVTLIAGQPALMDGILVRLPSELQTSYQLNWYAFEARPGWSKCPQGFAVYVEIDAFGQKYVLPGLLLKDEPRPKNWKIHPQPVIFTRDQIKQFTRSMFEASERAQRQKDDEVRALIHDLRALSGNIYHSTQDAKDACERAGYPYAVNRIETVLASQGMLSLRIDMLSYATDPLGFGSLESVPVFRKVDKIVRCFRPSAKDRGINFVLSGRSVAQTRGPNNFELIPYAIIDNAVKYTPNHSTIGVTVDERNDDIFVEINSLGPFLAPSERTKIFESGYRGIHAIKSKQTGTGIGLATANKLVSQFNGKILVEQDAAAQEVGAASYFMTKFTIRVPRIKS